ncbi:MAG: hypothetical protein BM557_03050 [Flavobacterium sp. MedPE-SWcel]|nr:MAG: hypothetical protein BM557_03050 [Flavobacterium sp. MedPE-SWcel]
MVVFNAVAQSSKCEDQFALYEEKVKTREYSDAEGLLEALLKECPKFDAKIYTHAEEVYSYKIRTSRTPEDSQVNIETLISIYDDYEKSFPGNGSVVRKALLLKKHKLADDAKVYKMLDTFFNTHKKKFIDYDALQTYFILYFDQYESEETTITQKDFVEKYAAIAGQVAYAQNELIALKASLLEKQETQMLTDEEKQTIADAKPAIDALDAVADNISIMASKHFSCEILSEYYGKSYAKHKEDVAWLEAVSVVMYNNKCYNDEVLYKVANALYKLRPTMESVYNLGVITLKRGNAKEAVKYFDQAANMDNDIKSKADKYYKIASTYRSVDKAEAKKYALKAAETNPEFGKPYLMLAAMYSSVTKGCDLTDFERKALLFLAMETAKKAEDAEQRYKPTVAALMEQYGERLPSKSEAKAAGYRRGKEITYGCWINETVKLPKMK